MNIFKTKLYQDIHPSSAYIALFSQDFLNGTCLTNTEQAAGYTIIIATVRIEHFQDKIMSKYTSRPTRRTKVCHFPKICLIMAHFPHPPQKWM